MKHVIIGTAGHIDHGKTLLTKALTGVDCDRLKEEQKRGITIENGFANLILPNGQRASIIDVPGHEKFVKNMIVGATGVDAVLLVVAADEGVMPQTIEHLNILKLLRVQIGMVVITKADMVDEEMLELVKADIEDRVAGTFLENAPMRAVSSYTGMGIEELKQDIVGLVHDASEKNSDRKFRLPVDRVFTMQGHGTVVTGTSMDGVIKNGADVTVYPSRRKTRIRELQNHNEPAEKVSSGMRVAMNLAGLEKEDLQRGDVIAEPFSMILTLRVDVKLEITEDCPYIIKNASQVHFYHGTREMVGKIRLLEGDEAKAGDVTFAQIRFKEPLAARNGDRFIIRFFSPMITVGGGEILEVSPRNHKRCHPETLEALQNLASEDYAVRLNQVIREQSYFLSTEDELMSRENESRSVIKQALRKLQDQGTVLLVEDGYLSKAALQEFTEQVRELLSEYHKENPLKNGMNIAELREKIYGQRLPKKERLLEYLEGQGTLRFDREAVALAEFEPTVLEGYDDLRKEITDYYKELGVLCPSDKEVAEQSFTKDEKAFRRVFDRMRKDGELIALTEHYCVWHEAYELALATFRKMSEEQEEITLLEFKERMEFSRKFAQMYLEYWDRTQITRRVGDAHVLRKR